VILDLKGKITLGDGDERVKERVNSLVNQGRRKIALNLADVSYIDSAGLGELVRAYTTLRRQGGSFRLLNLNRRITNLLSVTGLLDTFGAGPWDDGPSGVGTTVPTHPPRLPRRSSFSVAIPPSEPETE